MSCQLLLHLKLNVVGEELVLPLDGGLTRSQPARLGLLFIFLLDMPGAHYVVDPEHARLGAFSLLLCCDAGDVVDDRLVVSEGVTELVDDLTRWLLLGSLDLDLIVALICPIIRADPVIHIQLLLPRALHIQELLLDAPARRFHGAVHLLDVLEAVELLGRCVVEVLREFRI